MAKQSVKNTKEAAKASAQPGKRKKDPPVTEPQAFVPQPSQKDIALDMALKCRMNAAFECQILFFYVQSEEETSSVRNWLVERFGDPIPFTFGVRIGKPSKDVLDNHTHERNSEMDDE